MEIFWHHHPATFLFLLASGMVWNYRIFSDRRRHHASPPRRERRRSPIEQRRFHQKRSPSPRRRRSRSSSGDDRLWYFPFKKRIYPIFPGKSGKRAALPRERSAMIASRLRQNGNPPGLIEFQFLIVILAILEGAPVHRLENPDPGLLPGKDVTILRALPRRKENHHLKGFFIFNDVILLYFFREKEKSKSASKSPSQERNFDSHIPAHLRTQVFFLLKTAPSKQYWKPFSWS